VAAAGYSFGSQMGGDDPESDSLGRLLTYGANSDDETTGQPNSQPNVKSDASAPIAPAAHVQAVTQAKSTPAATTTPRTATTYAAATPPVSQAMQAPTAPVIDRDLQEALNAQKAKDEIVSNVSPKWWERALGGLTAGAMAFGHMPGAVEAGQAVTNRGQIAAEQQRQGRLNADNAELQAWQDGLNQQQQDFQNRSTAYRNQQEGIRTDQLNADRAAQEQQRLQAVAPGSEAPDDPKNPLGTWHATSVGGKPIALQGPPDKWAKSPAGIAAQRDADVTRMGLTGDDAKFYRANGKLKESSPTSIRIPSEGVQALSEARAAWQRENPGKKPTLSDLREIRAAADGKADATGPKTRGTPGQFADLDKQTAAAYAKAEAAYKTASDNAANDDDRRAALADLNAEKARIGSEHSQRLRDLGGIPAEDSQDGGATQSTPVGTQKAPRPNTPLTNSAIATAYLKAAGGDKAKARAAAKKDGWKF